MLVCRFIILSITRYLAHPIVIYIVDNCLESLHEYLPTLKDLCDFKCKHKRPHIEEVSTLSPRFKHLPKCAVARVIFMFPGVNQAKLEPLVRKLYYPTFIVQLPTVYRSFEEMAGEIVEVSSNVFICFISIMDKTQLIYRDFIFKLRYNTIN